VGLAEVLGSNGALARMLEFAPEATMKCNQAPRRTLLVALVLGAFCFFAFPSSLGGQAGDSQSHTAQSPTTDSPKLANERDIATRKKALLDETTDLEAMAKSVTGVEFDAAMNLDREAGEGVMELDATLWFLGVYDNMQCEPDREVAEAALKNRLGFYSHLLGLEADQAAGYLSFTKLPATAQAGQRVKEELRTAKNRLDEIAASLE
jgi:hypothetical protein